MLLSSLAMPPEPVSRPERQRALLVGLGLALLHALALYAAAHLFDRADPANSSYITLSFLIGMPVAAPAIAVAIADPHGRWPVRSHAGLGVQIFFLLAVAGMLVDGLGVCLLLAAPLFAPLAVVSAVVVGALLRRRGRLGVNVLPVLPFVLMPFDRAFPPPPEPVAVTTSVVIPAAPAAVWSALVEVRAIRPQEQRFTFVQSLLGVPRPLDARLDRAGAGGVRHVRWGKGVHFQEVVSDWQPGRRLAWTFAFPPDAFGTAIDGHIWPDSAYLKVTDGEYRLQPHAGGTRLTLVTRYRLATRLNGWCRLWGEWLIGDVHRNVLHVIAGRAATA